MSPRQTVNRRQFIASVAAASSVPALAAAQDTPPPPFRLDATPVLQNPTPTSITITWAVTAPATGWVEYGDTPQLGQRAESSTDGLVAYHARFLHATLTDLTPGTIIYYRVVSVPITFHSAYKIERGEPVASKTFRFNVADPNAAEATFAVINDTHENPQTLASLTVALREHPAGCTIWNGDVFNDIFTHDQIIAQAMRPANAAYAAQSPVLFVAGNHDVRGPLARELSQAFAPWREHEPLGRCFAVRRGPVALIGLDTGEDKPDAHPVFAGLAAFEPYRRQQRDWLAAVLQRPDIAAAPFLVACCHIPLIGLSGENGGDTLEGYGRFCRQAQQLWSPLLHAAGAQLVISGHIHQHRYLPPEASRSFAQLVGGGPQPDRATLIRAHATPAKLKISTHQLDGKVLGEWEFKPR